MSIRLTILVIVLSVGCLTVLSVQDRVDNDLVVHVLDVDQGDAILVRFPDRSLMLIDGGPGDYALVRLGEVLPPWARKIDTVVLTHPHADHLNGLLDIFERYQVKTFVVNPVCDISLEYNHILRMVESKGITVVEMNKIRLRTVMVGGVEVLLWSSDNKYSGVQDLKLSKGIGACGELGALNNYSVFVLLRYGSVSLALTGDGEQELEASLLSDSEAWKFRNVDILKAGHHCSRTASSGSFLDFINPDLAICSCGEDNKFDHPHPEALGRFRERGIEYLRTDEVGTITIRADGVGWALE